MVKLPPEPSIEDGLFKRCSDPFFSQLPFTSERNDWLEFDASISLAHKHQLYIRNVFKSIAEQVFFKDDPNQRKYAVVSGKPGTGKSVFLNYVLWLLVQEKKGVFYFSADQPLYFDGS